MGLPLSDIRIVDFTSVFAGPFGAMLLADQGAEVIKLESPEGDSTRAASIGLAHDLNGMSIRFLPFNRNKRSIVVDITKPQGREVAYDLFRWADVLLINLRVGTRQRRGFTYEDVKRINPKIVYASITGFGEEGPEADLPGIDIVNQARTGDIGSRQRPGEAPPSHTNLFHIDMATSMLIGYSVMLALRQRDRTGQGQKIDLNLLQSALVLNSCNMLRVEGREDEVYPTLPSGMPVNYRCSDGRYILAMTTGDRWEPFCRAMGLESLLTDSRFDTPQKRAQHASELYQLLASHFATRPAAEWETILKAHSLIVSVIKRLAEVYDDPQVIANDMFVKYDQPKVGTVQANNVPFKLSSTAGEEWLRRPNPILGQHTDEVLKELGYSAEQVRSLKAEGAIGLK